MYDVQARGVLTISTMPNVGKVGHAYCLITQHERATWSLPVSPLTSAVLLGSMKYIKSYAKTFGRDLESSALYTPIFIVGFRKPASLTSAPSKVAGKTEGHLEDIPESREKRDKR